MSTTRPETARQFSAVAGTRWPASHANMTVRPRGHDAGEGASSKGRFPALRLEPHRPVRAGATTCSTPGYGVER
jgi:hypothetical protein